MARGKLGGVALVQQQYEDLKASLKDKTTTQLADLIELQFKRTSEQVQKSGSRDRLKEAWGVEKRVEDRSADLVAEIEKSGDPDPDGLLLKLAKSLAIEVATDVIGVEMVRLQKEDAHRRAVWQPLIEMIQPLATTLDLGPGDEIVSVAIRGADGSITVKQVG